MTNQITLEELLQLVSVKQTSDGGWHIDDVKGSVFGVVFGDVHSDVNGTVFGAVLGNINGYVFGKISGREWQFAETPEDKLKRLIEQGADKGQLLEAFNQLKNN